MAHIKSKPTLHQAKEIYLEEQNHFKTDKRWRAFVTSSQRLHESARRGALPFDPRFNAVHWAFNVSSLCREIVFSYCWMKAYAKLYTEHVSPVAQPAHVDFHVTYFADNCITRIDSCRDKLALMVWAYYCPFNPEKKDETLDYYQIVERLTYPIKFGIVLRNHLAFLRILQTLKGDDFARVEKYRNYKVHRMEPRIELYGVAAHHGWSYTIPVIQEKDMQRWEKELQKQYPDKHFREHINKGCYIKGVLYDRRRIKDSIWDYNEVEKHVESSMAKIMTASANAFKILVSRPPLKAKRKRT
ncbi:MAG: Cthe_2314 family HEPN domain-containing protein [Nitrospiraceae bacterium]|nr:Cthe_2314 family HEPN domain-containing protein [Nitrospiraceae bacterium]